MPVFPPLLRQAFATLACEQAPAMDGAAWREALLAASRVVRQQRPPEREEHWARHCIEKWHITIDGDELTWAASSYVAQYASEQRLIYDYAAAVATLGEIPALAEGQAAALTAHSVTPEAARGLRLAQQAARLRPLVRELIDDAVGLRDDLAHVALVGRGFENRERVVCVHRVRRLLAEHDRRQRPPTWRETTAIMWFHSWDVDPDRPEDVDTLRAEYSRWTRRIG